MKVLFLRFSAIGDILLTTPVLRNWRRCRPGDELHVAVKAPFADLLAHAPYVDRVHALGPEADLPALIRRWRGEGFGAVVDLHRNWRTLRVKAALAGVPSRSFRKRNTAKWAHIRTKAERFAVPHVVQRYLATVAPFGVTDDGLGLDANVPEEAFARTGESLPPRFREGYDALVLGARRATKRMPPDLLAGIVRAAPRPLVLIGGPEDADAGAGLAALRPDAVHNAAGRHDLPGSAALLAGAGRVVAPDTGMMHWAAAFGKPICSVWGNTTPAFGMYPYFGGPDPRRAYREAGGALALAPDVPCRPCSRLGHDACPRGHFRCMAGQEAVAIAAWLGDGRLRPGLVAP